MDFKYLYMRDIAYLLCQKVIAVIAIFANFSFLYVRALHARGSFMAEIVKKLKKIILKRRNFSSIKKK